MNKNKIFVIVGLIATIIATIVIILLINDKKPITYNISFNTNGGSLIETQIVNKGEKANKPNDPIKEGYMFVEWTYNGKIYDFNQEVNSDLTLVAKWVEIKQNVETFIVKFDSDGGTSISNQIVEKDNKVEKPIDPVKEGYIFKGWMLNDTIYDFEKTVDNNIELKAKWEKIKEPHNDDTTKPSTPTKNKYTITFNSNGGSTVKAQTVVEGAKATQPSNPTRSGYNFAGWLLNGNVYDFSSTVTSNITLVAKWTEVVKNNYTVTFNSNGGSSVKAQTVVEGAKATQPNNPTRSGYNFAGWLLNGNKYNFNSAVTNNITLIAKWTQKSYTVVATKVDAYSPDSTLSVYEDGKKITVKAIKYSDGTDLCSGTNLTVYTDDIAGESSFKVVLSDGTQVSAKLS